MRNSSLPRLLIRKLFLGLEMAASNQNCQWVFLLPTKINLELGSDGHSNSLYNIS